MKVTFSSLCNLEPAARQHRAALLSRDSSSKPVAYNASGSLFCLGMKVSSRKNGIYQPLMSNSLSINAGIRSKTDQITNQTLLMVTARNCDSFSLT